MTARTALGLVRFIVAVFPLCVAGAIGLCKTRHRPQGPLLDRQPWEYRDVMVALIVARVWSVVAHLPIAGNMLPGQRVLMLGAMEEASILLVVCGLISWKYHLPLSALGLSETRILQQVLPFLAIALAGTLCLGLLLWRFSSAEVLDDAGGILEGSPLAMALRHADVGFVLAGRSFETILLAPVAEEVLFRGFMYGPTARKVGLPGAALVSSIVWTLFHDVDPLAYPFIFALGLVLSYVYHRTQSLWPPITLHASKNVGSVLFKLSKSFRRPGALLFPGLIGLAALLVLCLSAMKLMKERKVD